MSLQMTDTSNEVLVWIEGSVGRLRLNRPERLNALSHAMFKTIREALDGWRDDPSVQCVVIEGAGEKAFCAGGDVTSLHAARGTEIEVQGHFWIDQYGLDNAIARYPKPYVALMDGIVMGGGAGVSVHGSHRIVTERTVFAMPECAIGFLPDVGGTWFLGQARGQMGKWVGMTGARLDAADALHIGVADAFMHSNQLPELVDALIAGASVDKAIASLKTIPQSGFVEAHAAKINSVFSAPTARECMSRLGTMAEDGDLWADEALLGMRRGSPFAVTAAFEAHEMARSMKGVDEAFALEYRFACNMWGGDEFFEGIRALLIDKDKKPRWNPSSLEDVDIDEVRRWLTSLPSGSELSELVF